MRTMGYMPTEMELIELSQQICESLTWNFDGGDFKPSLFKQDVCIS